MTVLTIKENKTANHLPCILGLCSTIFSSVMDIRRFIITNSLTTHKMEYAFALRSVAYVV